MPPLLSYRFNQMVFLDWVYIIGTGVGPWGLFPYRSLSRSCGNELLFTLLTGWAGVLHDGMDCYD